MKSPKISRQEMMKNVARWRDLKSADHAFVDVLLPDHARKLYNVFGGGAFDDPNLKPALGHIEGFNMSYIHSRPGTRGALHAHDTVEVFIAISGKWRIIWGENEEESLDLELGDVIAFPPYLMHCFKNIGDTEALMIGMLDGRSVPGRVIWPEQVIENAIREGEKYGIGVSNDRQLYRLDSAKPRLAGSDASFE